MAGAVRGVDALQDEILKAKESLMNVDENIKKLTGRDPSIPGQRVGGGPRRVSGGVGPGEFRGRERIFNLARRGLVDDGPSPAKRRAIGGAFSRLGPVPQARRGPRGHDSGDEEDPHNRPAVQSSIVATPIESRSRKDSIEEQNQDSKGKSRNRRMFGLLLGTLQKFKDESKQETSQDQQRKAIEKKLEEKAVQEKEEVKRERQTLFSERRNQQTKIRRLEQKMELAKIHEEWEAQTRLLTNFIRTNSKPHIYFLPKSHTPETATKQNDTIKVIEDIIAERRQALEEDIDALMVHDENTEREDQHGNLGEADGEGDREVETEREKHRNDKENLDKESEKQSPKKERHYRDHASHRESDEVEKKESSSKEHRHSHRERERRHSGVDNSRRSRRESGKESSSRDRKDSGGRKHSENDRERRHSDRSRRERRHSEGKKESRHSEGGRDRKDSDKDKDHDRKRKRTASENAKEVVVDSGQVENIALPPPKEWTPPEEGEIEEDIKEDVTNGVNVKGEEVNGQVASNNDSEPMTTE